MATVTHMPTWLFMFVVVGTYVTGVLTGGAVVWAISKLKRLHGK